MSESIHEKMMKTHSGSAGLNGKLPEMKKASFEVVLKDKKQIASGTMAFIFEKPKALTFKAGQHIRMSLIDPPETDAEGDSRFFSLASTPQDADLVIAMRMRDTAFKRVLKQMQIGSKVLIQVLLNAPHGAFALHNEATIPAVYIVGGIGIVPAYSMIKDATERKLPHKLLLFYSNRRPEDATFLDELQKLAQNNPNFTLVAIMTEPEKSAQDWRGETERINSAMLKKYIVDLRSPIYYVSGLPEMVSGVQTMLKETGVSKDSIQAEEFTGFNLNEIARDSAPGKAWTRNLPLIAIVMVIIGVIIFHITGSNLLFHSGFSTLSLKNPVSYIFIILLLITVLFKLKLLWSLRHSKGKDLMRDFIKMHKLNRK